MPRMPKQPAPPCEHYPVSASEDVKLKLLESKLVPRDLSGETVETIANESALLYIDDNGVSKTISVANLLEAASGGKLKEALTTNITVGGIPAGTTFAVNTKIETILKQMLCTDKVLQNIYIATPPTKVAYTSGEVFDPAGMVVKAHYSIGDDVVITNYTYEPTRALATTDNKIVISYSGKTAEQAITVTSAAIKIYSGVRSEMPQTNADVEAMTLDQTKEKAALLENGYTWKNCTTNNEYFILAIPNNCGICCYDIKTNGYSAACEESSIGDYLVYTVGVKSTDTYRVVYSFEED